MNQYLQTLQSTIAPYQEKARSWWQSRLPREQLVLKLLAAVLVVFLLYSLVWQPVVNARNNAKAQYLSASQTYQWLQANEKAVMATRGNTQGTAQNNDWVMNINQSAQSHQLSLKGFTPQGKQKVSVVLDKQPFANVIDWLSTLQKQGIATTSLVLSDTTSAGRVNAQITLESH